MPRRLRSAIEDPGNSIFVSVVYVWEIAIKRARGRLNFAVPNVDTVARLGFQLPPVTGRHAEQAGGLPRHHNDPFERMLIAQAMLEGLLLSTTDRAMRRYGVPMLGVCVAHSAGLPLSGFLNPSLTAA